MTKKKIGHRMIIVTFIVIICFSRFFWIFLEKFADSANYENRKMASRPRLTLDHYGTYSEEYNAYFNDNIPFRNNLITINTAIDYFLFNKSTSDAVIVGTDNWLFYSSTVDGDSMSDYEGTNLLSEEELAVIAQNCVKQRDFLAEQNKEFVIFIAPNKERIYYENMPKQYGIPADNYRALQVVEYLCNNTDLRVVYPYEELMKIRDNLRENIWYKTDTHWNGIGGYVGASALLKELGIEMPAVDGADITISTEYNVSGDLASMLNLTNQLKFADNEYSVEGYDAHNMESIEWEFENAFIFRSNDADSRKIYVLRDSFATHMAAYIGSQFNNSYFRNRNSYSYDDFVTQNPDIFVYETVERSVRGLMDFSIQ